MAHISENSHPLQVRQVAIQSWEGAQIAAKGFNEVCVLRLPSNSKTIEYTYPLDSIGERIEDIAE